MAPFFGEFGNPQGEEILIDLSADECWVGATIDETQPATHDFVMGANWDEANCELKTDSTDKTRLNSHRLKLKGVKEYLQPPTTDGSIPVY